MLKRTLSWALLLRLISLILFGISFYQAYFIFTKRVSVNGVDCWWIECRSINMLEYLIFGGGHSFNSLIFFAGVGVLLLGLSTLNIKVAYWSLHIALWFISISFWYPIMMFFGVTAYTIPFTFWPLALATLLGSIILLALYIPLTRLLRKLFIPPMSETMMIQQIQRRR